MIEKFAGYGFNKSHSTAYALIAYQTAYLKAHYPVEFMAALLSGDIPGRNFKSKDSLVEHLEDCKRMGVEVVPPDVNSSCADFAVVAGKIPFGLSAIKACGSGAADAIVAARKIGRPVPQPVRLLRAGRSAGMQPRHDRSARQGRRVRFARREAGPADGRDRPGHADRRRGGGRPAQRPAGTVR